MISPMPLARARQHAEHKVRSGQTKPPIAGRLLALLDREPGPIVDYYALLLAATFPDPPPVVFHTAAPAGRESIREEGLRTSDPGQSEHWAVPIGREMCVIMQGWQPHGVYVGAQPDIRGVWSHWPTWDIWRIERRDLPWQHDELNPGCWVLTAHVPTSSIELLHTVDSASLACR
ncbi:MAG TPA: hypothetical protein VGO80_06710 [Solirubrobacteraceae bacterium]|nr:hypothetical protein [Solirubrobacteraceae bacterium]